LICLNSLFVFIPGPELRVWTAVKPAFVSEAGLSQTATFAERRTLKKLAPRAGIEERRLDDTLRLVKARQEEISGEASEAEAPPITGPKEVRNV
jgi:hypothetical protein